MFSPVITTIPEGPSSNHPREADICCLSRSKLSEDPTEQKIENQLYSTAGHGTRSLEFEEAENYLTLTTSSLYFSKVSGILYWLANSTHEISVSRLINKWFYEMLQNWHTYSFFWIYPVSLLVRPLSVIIFLIHISAFPQHIYSAMYEILFPFTTFAMFWGSFHFSLFQYVPWNILWPNLTHLNQCS